MKKLVVVFLISVMLVVSLCGTAFAASSVSISSAFAGAEVPVDTKLPVTFTYSATNGEGLTYYVNNTPYTTTENRVLIPVSEGFNQVYAVLKDSSGKVTAASDTICFIGVRSAVTHTNVNDGFAKNGSDRIVKGCAINSDNSQTTTYHAMKSITSDTNNQVVQLTHSGTKKDEKTEHPDAYLRTPDFGATATNISLGKTVVYEFDEMFENFAAENSVGGVHYYMGENQKQAVGILYHNTNGQLYLRNYYEDNGTIKQNTSKTPIKQLSANTWYNFKYVIDTAKNRISVFVDNEALLVDAPIFTQNVQGVRYLYRNAYSKDSNVYTCYLDNVKCTVVENQPIPRNISAPIYKSAGDVVTSLSSVAAGESFSAGFYLTKEASNIPLICITAVYSGGMLVNCAVNNVDSITDLTRVSLEISEIAENISSDIRVKTFIWGKDELSPIEQFIME